MDFVFQLLAITIVLSKKGIVFLSHPGNAAVTEYVNCFPGTLFARGDWLSESPLQSSQSVSPSFWTTAALYSCAKKINAVSLVHSSPGLFVNLCKDSYNIGKSRS